MLEEQEPGGGGPGGGRGGRGVQADGLHAAVLPVPCHHAGTQGGGGVGCGTLGPPSGQLPWALGAPTSQEKHSRAAVTSLSGRGLTGDRLVPPNLTDTWGACDWGARHAETPLLRSGGLGSLLVFKVSLVCGSHLLGRAAE